MTATKVHGRARRTERLRLATQLQRWTLRIIDGFLKLERDVQQRSTATVPPLNTSRDVQMRIDERQLSLSADDAVPLQAEVLGAREGAVAGPSGWLVAETFDGGCRIDRIRQDAHPRPRAAGADAITDSITVLAELIRESRLVELRT